MTRRIAATCCLLSCLVSPSVGRAADLEAGVNWLLSQQAQDGSWGTSSPGQVRPEQATAAALEALRAIGRDDAPYSSGLAWVLAQGAEVTEELAWRIVLQSPSASLEADRALLVGARSDGGWPPAVGHRPEPLDTAAALRSLALAGGMEAAAAQAALSSLTEAQNSDGGWGAGENSSDVFVTGQVVEAIIAYRERFLLEESITGALAFLRLQANPDGSIGADLVSSAAAYAAAIRAGDNVQTSFPKTQPFFTASQAPDGSWDEDVFVTSLVLRALSLLKPNLVVTAADITFSNPFPVEGETTSVGVAVRNTGPVAVENILVRIFDGNPDLGSQIGPDLRVAELAAYGSAAVSVDWLATVGGSRHEFFAVLDESEEIAESREDDNSACAKITVSLLPDLALSDGDVSWTPPVPRTSDAVTVKARVRNLGQAAAGAFSAKLFLGHPGTGGTSLGSHVVGGLEGGAETTLMWEGNLPEGRQLLHIVIDEERLIKESNDDNNGGQATLFVYPPSEGLPDLALVSVIAAPVIPAAGESVSIAASIENRGEIAVGEALVELWGEPPSGVMELLAAATVTDLAPASSLEIQFPVALAEGRHRLLAKADPSNALAEASETNNVAELSLNVLPTGTAAADFAVFDFEVEYPRDAYSDESIRLRLPVHNLGTIQAPGGEVALFDGDPHAGGALLAVHALGEIPSGKEASVTFDTLLEAGLHELHVVADEGNLVVEVNEANNTAVLLLLVIDPPPDLPDLTAEPRDVSFLPLFPKPGDLTTIQAVVRNVGTQPAVDVRVRVYDGDPQGGVLLHEEVIDGIAPQGWTPIQATGSFGLGEHTVALVIDPLDTVAEINELNNSTANTLKVYTAPDLVVTPSDVTLLPPMPYSDERVTLRALVTNLGESPAEDVAVAFYDGDPSQGGQLLGSPYRIPRIHGGGTTSVEKSFFLAPGGHDVLLRIDHEALVAESDETNNTVSVPITVGERTDLSCGPEGVMVSPAAPAEGQPVEISAVVRNGGSAMVDDMVVAFFDGPPLTGGTQLGAVQSVGALAAGESRLVSTTAHLGGGYREIHAVVDHFASIGESNERNNECWRGVGVPTALPDVGVRRGELTHQPYAPGEGAPLSLEVEVGNFGGVDLAGIQVAFYDGPPPAGVLLDSVTVDVPVASSTKAGVTVALAGGTHKIYARADSGDVWTEANEGNNLASVSIDVSPLLGYYDDSGDPAREPHLAQGAKVRLDRLPAELGEEALTASADPEAVRYVYQGLDPSAVYRVTVVAVEEPGGGRVEALKADGLYLSAALDVPDDKPLVRSTYLPRDVYRDGEVTLSVEAASESGAIVSQVWLVRETGRKETAVSQGLGWLEGRAGHWDPGDNVGWDSVEETNLVPILLAAYVSGWQGDNPRVPAVLDKVRALQGADGSWGESCSSTSQALTALLDAGVDPQDGVVQGGIAWLKRQVNPDGGWGERSGLASRPRVTGRVLMVLMLSGEAATDPHAVNAVAWLKSVQNYTGYWGDYVGDADYAGIGAWPAIGMFLATSPLDDDVQRAIARFKQIYSLSEAYNYIWAHLLRLYHYCGGSQSEISYAVYVLRSRQRADGSWIEYGRVYPEVERTALIVETLSKTGGVTSSEIAGFAWLDSHLTLDAGLRGLQQELDVSRSSLAVVAMAHAGNLASQLELEKAENTLVAFQQDNGFWSFEFFSVSGGHTFPSAYALQALGTTSYEAPLESATVASAVDFLLAAQNPDGGWSDYHRSARNASTVKDTATVLVGLLKTGVAPGHYRVVVATDEWLLPRRGIDGGWGTTRDTSWAALALIEQGHHAQEVQDAVAWLKANQNPDGGWGSLRTQTSVVEETSMALVALSGAGETGLEVAQGASWLVAARNPDGGWGMMAGGGASDSGNTALAVWALSVARYNLGIELEVLFNKPWYYPADLVSMAINPLNKAVDELHLSGSLADQYGNVAVLPATRETDSFSSEYLVPSDALPGANGVNFVALSDDAQGTVSDTFVVKSPLGETPDLGVDAGDIVLSDAEPDLGDAVVIGVAVRNLGLLDAQNVTVRFFHGDPASGGVQIGPDLFIPRVAGLGSSLAQVEWIALPPQGQIVVVIDPDDRIAEEREDNNRAARWIFVNEIIPRADLRVSSAELAIQPAVPYEGDILAVTLPVHNDGTASSPPCTVRFYESDPSVGGQPVASDVALPVLGAGATAEASTTVATSGRSGRLYLYAVVDPDDALEEGSEANNRAFSFVELRPMLLPDLLVSAGGMTVAPAPLVTGDVATVTVTVLNRGLAAANVEVALYDGDPDGGGRPVGAAQTIPGILAQGQERALQFIWETTDQGGSHTLHAVVDPAGRVAEAFEDNNRAAAAVEVISADLAVSVATSSESLGPNETTTVTVGVENLGDAAADAQLVVTITDAAGAMLATLARQDLALIAGETRQLSFDWNSGATRDGLYLVTASLLLEGRTTSRATAGVAITPDLTIHAEVYPDQVAYGPNQTARLTWRARNASANHDFTGLTATLTLSDAGGNLIVTDSRPVASLLRGQSVSFVSYWSTGTSAAGSYPLAATVHEGAVLRAGAAGSLTVSAGDNPAEQLAGAISAAPQEVLSGDAVTLTYQVTNVGNRDLPAVDFVVRIVSVDEQLVYEEIATQGALAMGETRVATHDLDTSARGARDYLAVLSAALGSESAPLASTWLRVQGAPSAPSVSSPAAGSEVEVPTPLLVVNPAADPNELDELTYRFELYADADLVTLVDASAPIEGGAATIAWQPAALLAENTRYWWRCRAFDGWSYGPWMAPAAFFVNTANDPPGAPSVDQPLDGQEVDALQPSLAVRNAFDPDEDALTYNFRIAADPGMVNVVAQAVGVFETPGSTAWQVDQPLAENMWFWWSAQADDWLDEGPWMGPVSFFVNTTNDAPGAPQPIAPPDGAETGASPLLVVANATDPDSAALSYSFELDKDPAFTSGALLASGPLGEGVGETTWPVPVALAENTRYYWRAKAHDGQAEGPWSATQGFFVNEVNEPPTAPVLANPSNGGEVIVLQPELVVHNATDPDGDALTYEFEVFAAAALTGPGAASAAVEAGPGGQTAWTVDLPLAENTTYWWRCRAGDGELTGGWMPAASFLVNTANDAPGAPHLVQPAAGASVEVLDPLLVVVNAVDPDGDPLTYQFEAYADAGLADLLAAASGVPEGAGVTAWTVSPPLADNTPCWWRARAFDGERFGPWMETASFTVHLPVTTIVATIDFDPDTLNLGSRGKWVTVYIELPSGYDPGSIDPATVLLQGTIPAELKPAGLGDEDGDGIPDFKVKFPRAAVEALLPVGEQVIVSVTGSAGGVDFEGIDMIRVIQP